MEATLERLIELLLVSKQVAGRSKRTIGWYEERLGTYVKWLRKRGCKGVLSDLNLQNARAFIQELQSRETRYEDHPLHVPQPGGLSKYYIHSFVRALKGFASWLEEEEYTRTHVLAKLKLPKKPKRVIEVLSEAEIQAIVDYINPHCFLGARAYAIVMIFLDTGMRVGELVGLTMDGLRLDEGFVKVLGKGDKERLIPIGSVAKKALLQYILTWRPEPASPEDDAVFLSPKGRPMTVNSAWQMLNRIGKNAGVPRLHPHLLRHTMAVRYLMEGGDVFSLQKILGHESLEMTRRYVELAASHVQVQHKKYSPMDRMFQGRAKGRRRKR
jgi:site-specific recombinase XerD